MSDCCKNNKRFCIKNLFSDCCRHARWWPHNWLNLQGLYIFFTVLFYLFAIFAIYMLCQIIPAYNHPMVAPETLFALILLFIGGFLATFLSLAIAKMLKALRKIKKAVDPCCCEKDVVKKEEEKSK